MNTTRREMTWTGRNGIRAVGTVRSLAAVVAVVLFVPVVSIGATLPDRAPRGGSEERFTVVLDADSMVASGDMSERGVAVRSSTMPNGSLLFRFHVAATDRSGHAIEDATAWEATILVGHRGGSPDSRRPLMYLSSGVREFTLPRPLGYRLSDGDSIIFMGIVRQGGSPRAVQLRLVIDYELDDASNSRLAVVPFPATAARPDTLAATSDSTRWSASWEWAPAVDGRVLAVAGPALQAASVIALDDVTTGERLWESAVRDERGESVFGRPGHVFRLGAQVKAGHVYRLSATLWMAPVEQGTQATGSVLAMILPAARAEAR
ncbi:MAG: hypothetical protein ABIP66_20760 [Gemmatimonadaceae bacterium]